MHRPLTTLLGFLGAISLSLYFSNAGAARSSSPEALETVIFAGGCFWCVESDFDKVPGVTKTVSGYTGGHLDNPTYKQVSRGGTGHLEAVQITFDPAITSYEHLVHLFWRSVDPTDAGGQFCDRGASYTTAIFATSGQQQETAEASKAALAGTTPFSTPVVTPIRPAAAFWPSEDYHQDYYQKKPIRYKYYRKSCGRDKRVKALWGEEAWATKKGH